MAHDNTRRTIALGLGATAASTLIPALAFAQEGGQQPEGQPGEQNPPTQQGFSEEEVVNRVSRLFGMGAELVAQAVEPIFRDQGRPSGYIEGSEGSAAIAVACSASASACHGSRRHWRSMAAKCSASAWLLGCDSSRLRRTAS